MYFNILNLDESREFPETGLRLKEYLGTLQISEKRNKHSPLTYLTWKTQKLVQSVNWTSDHLRIKSKYPQRVFYLQT